MKCTACGKGQLQPAYLDTLLPCHSCSVCDGSLLMMSDYLRWKGDVDHSISIECDAEEVEAEESTKALICPKTGGLMVKYKISQDTSHRIDLSPSINAVWIDKGEWELIKANGLAHSLNQILTDYWQHEIEAERSADMMREVYKRRFGDDYETLAEFRKALQKMPNRSEALAYLMAIDPYQS